jgi:hypothetical protein
MPQRAWSAKDERQYEHIKQSELERGVEMDEAKQIAGRTVNKTRRKDGRTPSKRTQGIGNPNTPIAERTRDELYNLAKELDVVGRGHMSKAELLREIAKKQS